MSDLHLEFFDKKESKKRFLRGLFNTKESIKSDVLVIAGDLALHDTVEDELRLIYSYYKKPIIFVYGNHCCYNYQKHLLEKQLKSFHHPEIHVLIDDILEIDDTVFFGSTGWWDGSGGYNGQHITHDVIDGMNDFCVIYDITQANYGLDWGRQSYKFFEYNLQKECYNNKKKVCISHNSPLKMNYGPYQFSNLNVCFHNNWVKLFDYDINTWIHGHIHSSRNEPYKNSTILCNPYGYHKYQENPNFRKTLITEV
jgi:calcineurin-like phosphoesterase family protein